LKRIVEGAVKVLDDRSRDDVRGRQRQSQQGYEYRRSKDSFNEQQPTHRHDLLGRKTAAASSAASSAGILPVCQSELDEPLKPLEDD
jgi:hypothetical protein